MTPDITRDEIVRQYGLDPERIGLRHRGYWIVEEIEEEERQAEAEIGDLCIKARDGGSNTPDMRAGMYPNYRGTATDGFDVTYRYYYYAPVSEQRRAS